MNEDFQFGDYVVIEQKRHGVANEFYLHKVVGPSQSNTWVDVPVQTPATETMHDEIVDVVRCICCGVDESTVRKYRAADLCKTNGHEPARTVDDLATLVRMLVRHVPDDKQIKAKALDYLKRKGLQGSPLRGDEGEMDG